MELFTPANKDCRGYTNSFKCNSCGALIYTAEYSKEIDFNYCPYCADAGIRRLKTKVSDIIKENKTGKINLQFLSLNSVAYLLGIDTETGEEKEGLE